MPDFKNSAMNIAYAMQGGLGLPDKTYYFDSDKRAIRDSLRKARCQGTRTVRRSARPGGGGGQGRARCRNAARPRIEIVGRALSRCFALLQPDQDSGCGHADTQFPLDRLLSRRRASPPPEQFSLAIPAFHQEVSRMLERPAGRAVEELSALSPRRWRLAVSERCLRHGALRVSQPNSARAEGNAAALEASARSDQRRGRRGDGPALR